MSPIERKPFVRKLRMATWGLTGASFLLLGVWLLEQRKELATLRWSQQGPLILGLVAMYGFSALVNFWVWHARNTAVSRLSWYRDMYLYAYSNLSRRLPSGLGYFLVRTARYPSEGLNSPTVILLSFQELSLQVISGILLIAVISIIVPDAVRPGYLVLAGCGALFVILGHTSLLDRVLRKLSKDRIQVPPHLLSPRVWPWLVPYGLTWLNGGLMLYWLLRDLTGSSSVDLWRVMLMWIFSGTVGIIAGVFPIGQFARDALLSILLIPYVPLSEAVLAALVFRLVLTIGDLVWNLFLMLIGILTHRAIASNE